MNTSSVQQAHSTPPPPARAEQNTALSPATEDTETEPIPLENTSKVRIEDLSDEQLLARRRAFEQEAVPYMDAVYHFAYNLTGNSDDASDLLQETFLKAFRFFDSFQQGTNCKAWLFQISKNSFINRYRKQTREPDKVRYDEIEEYYETLRPVNVDANNLEEHLFNNLLDDEVTGALQNLPEAFRTVLILSDIESLTYEEIAEVLNCPIGTVRSRLHRARKMVRDELLDYAKSKGFSSADTTTTATPTPQKNAPNASNTSSP
ncbi:MAG: sigma-70 family RNA polymerase sigma factor [Candidatus Kapaibacterium sp.]|nr:MAG: sigma-70 family RNA polymerase sigma factor [Candidatus Kapabacteria bacterium]